MSSVVDRNPKPKRADEPFRLQTKQARTLALQSRFVATALTTVRKSFAFPLKSKKNPRVGRTSCGGRDLYALIWTS